MGRLAKIALSVSALLVIASCGGTAQPAAGTAQPSGAAATAAPTAAPTATPNTTPIRVGGIFSLTGTQGVNGVVFRRGAEAAVKYVNSTGGINGRPLELTVNDDQSRPEQAIAFAQQIGGDKSLVAAIAFTGLTGPAGQEEMNKQEVPVIVLAGDESFDVNPGKWAFHIAPTFDRYSLAAMGFIRDTLKVTKVGLIWESTPYGQSFDKTMKAQAAQYGLTIVDSENVPQNAPDVTLNIQRTLNAGAQVIMLGTAATNAVPVNNWAALGSPVPLIGGIGLSSPAQAKGAEDAAKKLSAIIGLFSGNEPLPRQKAFVEQFQKTEGEVPQYQNALGWDAVVMMATVLRGGADTRVKVRDAIETKFTKYEGAAGIQTFTPTQHQGYDPTGLVFLKYNGNGQYSIFKK